ncbi:helix-turn-helix transcriptional regulator [Chelatococcus asaccharovorans]|nr:helix-turn-helix transcriptional regulator [Chelatococcus asaccharovorans]MBS7707364.1 helix-turn-helix transcriptional regulator [Chelatococcus asaccharovorans]
MSARTAFSDVVKSIYDATLDVDLWNSALDAVAGLSGSTGAVLYVKGRDGWTFPMHSAQISSALHDYVAEGWSLRNPWLEGRMEAGYRVGDVYRDLDIVTPREMRTNPFYTEFLHKFGLGRQMVAIIYSDIGNPTCLVSHRGMAKGPFRKNELQTHLLVARHVEQALRITSKFVKKEAENRSYAEIFDAVDYAMIVLDGDQRLVKLNREAEALIGNYFNHEKERLAPASREDAHAFTSAIQAAHKIQPGVQDAPHPITIGDRHGEERIVVWISPLVGAAADKLGFMSGKNNVLVLAQPLKRNRVIEPTIIRSIYGLSTGEARLASLLVSGRTVKDAAKELDLTEGTARFVLNQVFRKVGVHRQSELVAQMQELGRYVRARGT